MKIPANNSFAVRPLKTSDANIVAAFMRSQSAEYLRFFYAFGADETAIAEILAAVENDVYAGVFWQNNLAGIYMLRGWDEGYEIPAFGVLIDEKFRGTYDFFYLPIDFKNKCNVGYAFINMVRPEYIIPLIQKFDRKKWEKFNSEKVCNISYARIQVSHSHPFQADSVHASLFWGHTTRSQLHYALLVMELQFFHALLDKKLLHLQDIAMQIFV